MDKKSKIAWEYQSQQTQELNETPLGQITPDRKS